MNIPSKNKHSFEEVMVALDKFTEGNVISMDLSKVEADSENNIQIALTVYVPESKRIEVRDKVADYLEGLIDKGDAALGYSVNLGTKSNLQKQQFDLVMRYTDPIKLKKPQVIRVYVKPVNAGGSGGGSAATKVQEVGMALFCAIRYMKNKDLECSPKSAEGCLEDKDYEDAWKFVDGPGVTLEEIKGLSQDWKDSFIKGANKIYSEIGGTGWEFLRGDSVIEAEISNRFKTVVAKDPKAHLAQEDKWNPSDIWMIKTKEKNNILTLLKKEKTTDCLNNFLQLAFTDAEIPTVAKKKVPRRSLIGISLKKLGPVPQWKTQNWVGVSRLKKAEAISFQKQLTLNELTAFSAIDVYIVLEKGGTKRKGSFQARNFGGSSKGDWKLELKGEFAAQGKIQGQIARDILKRAEFTDIPSEPNWSDCATTSTNRSKINEEIYNIMNGLPTSPKGFKAGKKDEMLRELRKKDQSYAYSKLCGLRFLKYLISKNGDANTILKELWLYASSLSDKSSVHYKLM